MKIYDLSQNKVVQFPDYIARIKLRTRHISKGGIYCTVQDIEKYVSVPPVVKTTQEIQPGIAPQKEMSWENAGTKAHPVHMTVQVDAKNAQAEVQYPEDVTDITPEGLVVEKKRRKRKTE